jgi:hypothetical protein
VSLQPIALQHKPGLAELALRSQTGGVVSAEKAVIDDAWRVENQLKKSVETIAILTGLCRAQSNRRLGTVATSHRFTCDAERAR